jgi:hypothetical protein
MGCHRPKVYGDKPHQHSIAQHPRCVAAASLRRCKDPSDYRYHPGAAVQRHALQSIAGRSAAFNRPGASRRLSNRPSCVHWCLRRIFFRFRFSGIARARQSLPAAPEPECDISYGSKVRSEQSATRAQKKRGSQTTFKNKIFADQDLSAYFDPVDQLAFWPDSRPKLRVSGTEVRSRPTGFVRFATSKWTLVTRLLGETPRCQSLS